MSKKELGAAFDIGTTTIVGALIEENSNKILGELSRPNPQKANGADVLSRIRAIVADPKLLKGLQQEVVSTMDKIIGELLRGSDSDAEITEITAAGNSVMEHILCGISPEPLATVPYKPAFKEAKHLKANEFGFKSASKAIFYAFPLIGGFIGGDTVAVILAAGLQKKDCTALLLDIGTNSEIVLAHKGVLYSASAAAGPAFEAGDISCGMVAARGAIEKVTITNDEIRLNVIGSVAPIGLCGSGLVSAISELVDAGLIDKTGRIKEPDEISGNLALKIKNQDGLNSIVLYRGPAGEISLTQDDIRSLQNAKAAIRAGVEILMERAKITSKDIDEIHLAGAFGSKMDLNSLLGIGLLDSDLRDKVKPPLGDGALTGAIMTLFSEERKGEAARVAGSVKYISLSGTPSFERNFLGYMNF